MKFLVVGEVFLERFVIGQAIRIAHEAPVPIVVAKTVKDMAGGAATAAGNLRGLGHEVLIASVAGVDPAGAQLEALLDLEFGARQVCLARLPSRRTIVKHRIYAHSGGAPTLVARWDAEYSEPVTADDLVPLLGWMGMNRPYDGVLVCDYDRGLMIPPLCEALGSYDAPLLIDTRSPNLEKYSRATVLTANRQEYALWPHDAPGLFKRMVQLEAVLVKQDADGLVLYTPGGQYHQPALAGPVTDVLGAGDTADAIFLAAFASGLSWPDCLRLAAEAGKQQVAHVGIARVAL